MPFTEVLCAWQNEKIKQSLHGEILFYLVFFFFLIHKTKFLSETLIYILLHRREMMV